MPNIKFSYFYRDASNYKNFGRVIFANPSNVSLSDLEKLIREKLIDETYFYASQWKMPNLYFSDCNLELDPTWHEFGGIELSDEEPNIDIQFFEILRAINYKISS